MTLQELKNKKIAILGFGKEGQSTFKFLKTFFPKKKIGILDQKQGKDYLKKLKDYEIIFKSPGIPPKIIKPFLKKGQKITSQTAFFLENCQGKVIGVTGTKGKSTTTSLIYHILKTAKFKVYLIGNIGTPPLDFLKKDGPNVYFAFEMSSHQLLDIKKSPHIAVLLNIYKEHLDYYKNFRDYIKAKANITKYQTRKDYLIFNQDNEFVRKIAKTSKAKKIPIKGSYYELDINAAKAVAGLLNIKPKVIEKALQSFKKLPHRLEFVGTFKGIKFYNDSLATIPEATIFAMKYLGNSVQTLILGGFERHYDFKELAKEILKRKVKTVILFPDTGKRIWESICAVNKKKSKLPNHYFVNNMKDAVKLCYNNTEKGKICLLSPASPSFSLFKDYKERGDLFKKYVRELSKFK